MLDAVRRGGTWAVSCVRSAWNSPLSRAAATIPLKIGTVRVSSLLLQSPLSAKGAYFYGAINSLGKLVENWFAYAISQYSESASDVFCCNTVTKVVCFAVSTFFTKIVTNAYLGQPNCETVSNLEFCRETFSQEDSLALAGFSEVMHMGAIFSCYCLHRKYNFLRNIASNRIYGGCWLVNGGFWPELPFDRLDRETKIEKLREWFLHPPRFPPPGKMAEMCSYLFACKELLKELVPRMSESLLEEILDCALKEKNDARALHFLQLVYRHQPQFLDVPVGIGSMLHALLWSGLDESAFFWICASLERGKDLGEILDTPTLTQEGSTPLHLAVQTNCVKTMFLLGNLGANPSALDGKKRSVLQCAWKRRLPQAGIRFLERCLVNCRIPEGPHQPWLTILQCAMKFRLSLSIFDFLLTPKERFQMTSRIRNTLLHLTVLYDFENEDFLKKLLNAGLNPLTKNLGWPKEETPLSLAVRLGRSFFVLSFLRYAFEEKSLEIQNEYFKEMQEATCEKIASQELPA